MAALGTPIASIRRNMPFMHTPQPCPCPAPNPKTTPSSNRINPDYNSPSNSYQAEEHETDNYHINCPYQQYFMTPVNMESNNFESTYTPHGFVNHTPIPDRRRSITRFNDRGVFITNEHSASATVTGVAWCQFCVVFILIGFVSIVWIMAMYATSKLEEKYALRPIATPELNLTNILASETQN